MKTFTDFKKDFLPEAKDQAILRGVNKGGKKFALVKLAKNGNYLVYGQESHYRQGSQHVTWTPAEPKTRMSHKEQQDLITNGLPEAEARALYAKRLKGKAKG